jgi:uncharacterized protein (TIGR02271 family)
MNAPEQMFDYDVIASDGKSLGSVDGVWVDDATNQLEFVSVKTGTLLGKTHIIPVVNAQIGNGSIQVPYSEDQIKDAPSFGSDDVLSPEDEEEIYSYYGFDRSTSSSPSGLPEGESGVGTNYATGRTDLSQEDQRSIQLSEEELQVGKRQVEAGRVRLRKVVRTERREVPVELRREEIEIERVNASGAAVPGNAFQEEEIEVPVMREEAVTAKEAHVTGQVNVNKTVETEQQTVSGDIRKEDVEVDRDGDTQTGFTDTTPRDSRF